MVLSKEEKIKLLEKARAVRAAKLAKKRETNGSIPATPPVVEPEPEPEPDAKASASAPEPEPESKPEKLKRTKSAKTPAKPKETKKTLELNTVEDIRKAEDDFQVKEEKIRLKGNPKKKIIKRVIEVEESSTDEEIIEEVIQVPKIKKNKEVKINREEVKNKLKLQKEQRLMAELFGS